MAKSVCRLHERMDRDREEHCQFLIVISPLHSMGGRNSRKQNKKSKKMRRSGRGGALGGFLSTPSLFPARRVGTMVYDGLFNISPAASAAAYNTFRANSVFDPDFTGAGTTISGYTPLATVYNRYRVISCRADIVWSNPNAVNGLGFLIATPQNTVGTSYTAIMAQKFAWTKQLGNVNGPHLSHSVRFTVAQIYGTRTRAVLDEDDFAGLTGANPNNVVFLHIGVMNSTGTAFASPVQLQVRLTMKVEWSIPLLTST